MSQIIQDTMLIGIAISKCFIIYYTFVILLLPLEKTKRLYPNLKNIIVFRKVKKVKTTYEYMKKK